jgi:predicted transcriptional regulator
MRETQLLSQRRLAALAGVDRGHLAAVEAGKREPREDWLDRVKDALARNIEGRS